MKKKLLAIFLGLIMIVSIGCTKSDNKEKVKNNEDIIKEYILNNLELKRINEISIIDTVEIEDTKIVGFKTDKGLGIVLFDKDDNGKYMRGRDLTFNNLEAKSLKVSTFSARYGKLNNSAYIIISDGKELSKIELILNQKETYSKIVQLNKPSMVIFKDSLFKDKSNNREIGFNFFNSDGYKIDEN